MRRALYGCRRNRSSCVDFRQWQHLLGPEIPLRCETCRERTNQECICESIYGNAEEYGL